MDSIGLQDSDLSPDCGSGMAAQAGFSGSLPRVEGSVSVGQNGTSSSVISGPGGGSAASDLSPVERSAGGVGVGAAAEEAAAARSLSAFEPSILMSRATMS